MPTKNKEATLEALKEFRTAIEQALEDTGLNDCLLGQNRKTMPDSLVGIVGVHIAEFGRSGLSKTMSIAMDEIETVFKVRD